ncbi:hypothetical protein PAMP_009365 [Pampus punctatissimus]
METTVVMALTAEQGRRSVAIDPGSQGNQCMSKLKEYKQSLRLSRLPTLETHLRAQQLSIQTQCAPQVVWSQCTAPLCLLCLYGLWWER